MAQSKTTTKKHFRVKFKFKEFLREAWPLTPTGVLPLAQVREKVPYKPFLAGSPSLRSAALLSPGCHSTFVLPALGSSLQPSCLSETSPLAGLSNWEQQMTSQPSHSNASSQLLVLLNNWKRRIIQSAIWEAGQAHRLSQSELFTLDNWELPKLLFVVQASRGRTFKLESIHAGGGMESIGPESLCAAG